MSHGRYEAAGRLSVTDAGHSFRFIASLYIAFVVDGAHVH